MHKMTDNTAGCKQKPSSASNRRVSSPSSPRVTLSAEVRQLTPETSSISPYKWFVELVREVAIEVKN